MHNHMKDDQILVQTALTLARAVRDDIPKGWFARKAVMPGVGKIIRDISRQINSPDVAKEVWRFGAYITDIFDNDDLDGMISDYLETAATMSENEDYYG